MSAARPGPTAPARRFTAALLLTLLAVMGLLAPASAARADDSTIGIAGGPADANGPDGRTRLSYQVQPGQTVADKYVVRNTGTTDQTVTVFATDAYDTADGAYALLDTATPPAAAGAWVAFGGQHSVQVTLKPTEQQVLDFVLTVPADATPGDHAAGIVVSATGSDGQVKVDRRVATRLYVRVAGALQPNLTISSISASQPTTWNPLVGDTTVTVTLNNTGNVALGAKVTASAATWFGISTGAVRHTELPEMLPGTTREVTFHIPSVPPLGYLEPKDTVQPAPDPDALDPGPLREVSRSASLVSAPWVLIGLIVMVVGIVLVIRWRRRRLARQAAEWIEYQRAQARSEAAGGTSGSREVTA